MKAVAVIFQEVYHPDHSRSATVTSGLHNIRLHGVRKNISRAGIAALVLNAATGYLGAFLAAQGIKFTLCFSRQKRSFALFRVTKADETAASSGESEDNGNRFFIKPIKLLHYENRGHQCTSGLYQA
ncbi:hypothetical protein [Mucilaginibacter conchicola]|uniref:hypothetical protein n=1 Tax=Mucilaginibacter conchicola TaxID=2303333 RepID=UPI0011C18C9B|nr:hypothetical protein [Mucilaginibacter conchicola]